MIRALKRFVGRGLMNWIHDANKLDADQPPEAHSLNTMFSNSAPSLAVYTIGNGYIVLTQDYIAGTRQFYFCADAQAISEHIVTTEVKRKIGVQTDMFDKQQLLSQSYHAAIAQTRSTRI